MEAIGFVVYIYVYMCTRQNDTKRGYNVKLEGIT